MRAPPSQLPPPLPAQPPPDSATYPPGLGRTLDPSLAPNDKTGLEGVQKLGSSSSDGRSGSDDVDVETIKNVMTKVSVVRSDDFK